MPYIKSRNEAGEVPRTVWKRRRRRPGIMDFSHLTNPNIVTVYRDSYQIHDAFSWNL